MENICCICKNELENEFGNNAEPIKVGRCCDVCNDKYVIPARLADLQITTKEDDELIKQFSKQEQCNKHISKLALFNNDMNIDKATEWFRKSPFSTHNINER